MLNVDRNSSIAEIKSSYRKAASLYHPDNQSGHADVTKFHSIVQAYNIILDEIRNEKTEKRQSWLSRLLIRSRERILTLIIGGAKKRESVSDSYARQGYWATLNILIRKLDLAEHDADKIKSARAIFRLYRSSFARIVIPRLPTAEQPLLLELIKMLSSIGNKQAIEAIVPYLCCEDREVMVTTYVSLECAGPAGQAALAKAMGVEDSIFTRMMDMMGFRDISAGANNGVAPASQMRRMRAFALQGNTSMSNIMDRMGYTLRRSA
ncbi:MAG: J domain-containing protein [Nitrospinota bacterium]|nr:J domain-containing protein [Nitrospinota bacterium]